MQINTSNYLNLYSNSYNINSKESTQSISQNFNTTENLSQNNKNNVEREDLESFINEYSNIEKLDISLIINNNEIHIGMINNFEDIRSQAKNAPIPSEKEFQTNLEYLLNQIDNILMQGFNEYRNDKEFQSLLANYMMENRAVSKQTYEYSKQNALQALSQLQNGNKPDNFKETMSDYMGNSLLFSNLIGDFFYLAGYFNKIPQDQRNAIQDSLEKVQPYLLNQAGDLDNNFQLGNAIISWNGNDLPFKDYYIGEVEINFLENTSFASLSSNLDTTQSIFDILNQKEKLEKENQDLKNKQAIEAYSYGNGYSSTLTSKTSKEIDSFINQMIKEAKA